MPLLIYVNLPCLTSVPMGQKPGTKQSHGKKVVKDIRRAFCKQCSAHGKIRIVLDGLKGEFSIAEQFRRGCFAL